MIIVAFCKKTSKLLPKLFCRNFRHCAIIAPDKKSLVMYQFITWHKTKLIHLTATQLKMLVRAKWTLVYIPCEIPSNFEPNTSWTCVNMCKQALMIQHRWIITPDDLYNYISK